MRDYEARSAVGWMLLGLFAIAGAIAKFLPF